MYSLLAVSEMASSLSMWCPTPMDISLLRYKLDLRVRVSPS